MNSSYHHLTPLFLPGSSYFALPNAKNPRVYLPSEPLLYRWRKSRFYPAFRPSARLYRLALRAKVASGLGSFGSPSGEWQLGNYVKDVLPDITSAVMLIGTPGPAQKITVQLWNKDYVVGYFKYAEKPAALTRLEQEHSVLLALPEDVAPRVLKFGTFVQGLALVTTPVPGRALPARLPPAPGLRILLDQLTTPLSYSVEQHPWTSKLVKEHRECFTAWLEPLAARKWPVVVQHGDLAPWNVLKDTNGQLRAIDWEYGDPGGFPFIDLAYSLLQVAALIYHWPPARAKTYAVRYLNTQPWPGLTERQAHSIICLATYYSYHQAEDDGYPATTPLQVWRRELWEEV